MTTDPTLPEFRRFVSPDYDTTVIGAGAAYETRLNRNGYNVVSLDTGQGRGAIYFRAYSDRQGGFWAADPSVYESVPDGCYQFEIPSRLKVSTVGFGKTLLHWQISLKKHHSLLWEDRSWSGAGPETYPVHPNNEDSLWAILAALRRGQSVEILGSKTGISIEVLQRLHDRVDMEKSLLSAAPLTPELLIKAKKMGFTFEEIGTLVDKHSEQVRELCRTWNLPIDSYLEPDVPDLAFLLPSSTF